MPRTKIPLIRASQLLPFIEELQLLEVDPAKQLLRCRCPVSTDFTDPDNIIPTNRLWQFIEETSRSLGNKNLGWDIAMDYGVYGAGQFGYQLEHQRTLGDAINLYIGSISEHASVSSGQQNTGADCSWFYRATLPMKGSHYFQVEQYALGTLVHIVRSYLGSSWRPTRIAITSRPRQAQSYNIANSCDELIVGAARAGIEIPTKRISASSRKLRNSLQKPGKKSRPFPTETPNILRQMLGFYLDDYSLSHNTVSDILEISPRTLNRQLALYGQSFRDIRKDVIVERAKKELVSGKLSMLEISRLLRYANQSAFSRSFAQTMNESPGAYQQRIASKGMTT
ncbi:MAG: helix-turn-helix domain-containing protein [Halioglobus sp.]